MTPISNTKSIALLVIFFLAVGASEAARGINTAAATTQTQATATAIDIDEIFSSAVLGQHASLRAYDSYGDPSRTMNITVKCLRSIMDLMTCMDYFTDGTMPAPPPVCCNGCKSLVESPPCMCQVLNAGWNSILPRPPYIPHIVDAPTKCGIQKPTTPWPGCDAYMPHMPSPPSSPSPALAPAADTPAPSSPTPALVPSAASPVPSPASVM